MTKAQLRSLVQQWMDDPAAKRWTAPNLDLLIELTSDDLWGWILNAVPNAVSVLESPAVVSPGYIDLTTLTKRFYRVQSLVRNSRPYLKVDRRDAVLQDDVLITAPPFSYTFFGDQLWMFELDETTAVELRYNFLPEAFSLLADVDQVPWPAGHETALVLESAGRAMLKGEAEDPTQLLTLAARAQGRMIGSIKSRDTGPDTIYLADSPIEWGGV